MTPRDIHDKALSIVCPTCGMDMWRACAKRELPADDSHGPGTAKTVCGARMFAAGFSVDVLVDVLRAERGTVEKEYGRWRITEAARKHTAATRGDTLHPTGRCTCAGEGRCPWCSWRALN